MPICVDAIVSTFGGTILVRFTCLLTDVPSEPRSVVVSERSKDYVDLSWQCPDTDGGSPVVQYIVEKRDVTRAAEAGAMWMVCGTVAPSQLSVRVGKLLQGNAYLFRVSAENRVGTGPPAELQEPVVARLPYGISAPNSNSCELKIAVMSVVRDVNETIRH